MMPLTMLPLAVLPLTMLPLTVLPLTMLPLTTLPLTMLLFAMVPPSAAKGDRPPVSVGVLAVLCPRRTQPTCSLVRGRVGEG